MARNGKFDRLVRFTVGTIEAAAVLGQRRQHVAMHLERVTYVRHHFRAVLGEVARGE